MSLNQPLTIAVLGANGFVGSHIVNALSQYPGVQVRAFDRFSNTPKFEVTENTFITRGDLNDGAILENVLRGTDYVLHCFSATTPFIADKDPFMDITDNLLPSIKIFELCGKLGVKKIGFISSGGSIYGSASESGHASESDAPKPTSPYGIIKLTIEHYLEYFKRKNGTKYVIYRLTNPYGPGQVPKHSQGVVPIFLSHILKGEAITIYGDGHSSRDYIYINDAAEMIAQSFCTSNKYTTYNIGSGRQTSLNQIVKTLEKVTRKKAAVLYKEAPPTISRRTSVDVSRFVEEYGSLTCSTSLEAGLREIYTGWLKKNDQ